MYITRNSNKHDVLVVHGAIVSELAQFLDPKIPWVWILGHLPNCHVEWWESTVPLSKIASITGQLRGLSYDLQLSTSEFLMRAGDFDGHGLELIQANQRMPSTLLLDRIPEEQQDSILIQNGALVRIYLPHAIETAMVVCFQEGYLADRLKELGKCSD